MYKRKADLVIKAAVFSCLTMLVLFAVVDALAEPIQTRMVTARGGLNVRREPTTQSQIVYTLDETDIVVVSEWRDGWALVCNNNPPYMPIGWACGDWLK